MLLKSDLAFYLVDKKSKVHSVFTFTVLTILLMPRMCYAVVQSTAMTSDYMVSMVFQERGRVARGGLCRRVSRKRPELVSGQAGLAFRLSAVGQMVPSLPMKRKTLTDSAYSPYF